MVLALIKCIQMFIKELRDQIIAITIINCQDSVKKKCVAYEKITSAFFLSKTTSRKKTLCTKDAAAVVVVLIPRLVCAVCWNDDFYWFLCLHVSTISYAKKLCCYMPVWRRRQRVFICFSMVCFQFLLSFHSIHSIMTYTQTHTHTHTRHRFY